MLVVPIALDMGQIEPLARFGLPTIVSSNWYCQLDAVLRLPAAEEFGIHVPRIDDVFLRQKVALDQFRLQGGGHLHILDGSNRGLDLHHELGDGRGYLLLALLLGTRLREGDGCHLTRSGPAFCRLGLLGQKGNE